MYRKLTRVVMVSWLFLVLILNSSYTASLSSMLTIKQLQPNVTDIQWLKKNNMKIGCDGNSFVRTYLEKVEKFRPENIVSVPNDYNYVDAFANNSIAAAFLELPYAKVFISENCDGYSGSTPTVRFGGLGFMFQKGSPVAKDVSKAILHLSENAELKRLEEKWLLITSKGCSNNMTSNRAESLKLRSLWVLFVISGATSTICLILSTIQWQKLSQRVAPVGHNGTSSDENVWERVMTLARQVYNKQVNNSCDTHDATDRSSRWDHLSTADSTEHHQQESASPVPRIKRVFMRSFSLPEIQMSTTTDHRQAFSSVKTQKGVSIMYM